MAQGTSGDGLLRWLLGGVVAGAAVLGLLIGAYAIGYHRGQHHARSASPAPPAQPAPSTTPQTTTAAPASPAQRVALGKRLFTADGCASCHSLNGSAGAGPTVKGLAGSTVTLGNGQTVQADDHYLETAITDPDAQVVKGYSAGIMSGAVKSFDLTSKPADVAALVAFIKTQ